MADYIDLITFTDSDDDVRRAETGNFNGGLYCRNFIYRNLMLYIDLIYLWTVINAKF